jgi:imidazolonepropionase-like amidohydrolase
MHIQKPSYRLLARSRSILSWALLVFAVYAPVPATPVAGNDLALVGAKVYPDPQSAAIDDAVVLVHDGKIAGVGRRGKLTIPKSAEVIDCSGKVVTAGFWNSHVHFTTGWNDAASASAQQVERHMQAMLTRWGFTTVWDLGSDPQGTLALRQRVKAGEFPGPRILMAGAIFPKNGHPVYLPREMQLPEAATPEEATQMARSYLRMGLDGIKLFTGSFMGDKPVVNMDASVVKAAVAVAHGDGKPVFTHPQNRTGVDNALEGGVNVLAHTIPTEAGFTTDELSRMKAQHVALIPTLALWPIVVKDSPPQVGQRLLQAGVEQLKAYFSAGGTILFGTDVGFQDEYDTAHELEYMGRAMSWRDVLASLTTNPSGFFKEPNKGRVEKGKDADLVVLDDDPAADVRNLAKVAYTIREGKVIFRK